MFPVIVAMLFVTRDGRETFFAMSHVSLELSFEFEELLNWLELNARNTGTPIQNSPAIKSIMPLRDVKT